MRILLVTDHYPPFIGGAHRWAELLAHGLSRRGHELDVVTEWHGGLPREECEDGVRVHRVRQMRTVPTSRVSDDRQRHSPPFPDPFQVADLRRVIAGARPEVVLAHGWISTSAAVALRDSPVPLLGSAHDYGYFCPTRVLLHDGRPCSGPAPAKCLGCACGFYRGAAKGASAVGGVALARRILARRLDGLQSVTTFVDEQVWSRLFGSRTADAIRRYVIPAFLDTDRTGSATPPAVIDDYVARLPSEPFILFVGALRRIKGVDVLLAAHRRLANPPPLVLMGTLHDDTPPLDGERVSVFHDVPHGAVMAAWERAMFGVTPSVWPEPLGTVTIEGITQGRAMIATVPSGMVDVLQDGAGILVPSGDVAALAEAMERLIANPSLRDELGRTGRIRAPRFAAERVLGEYEGALAEMAAHPRVR